MKIQVWLCSSCVRHICVSCWGIKSSEVVVSVQLQQDRKCVTGCLTPQRCLHQTAQSVCVCVCVSVCVCVVDVMLFTTRAGNSCSSSQMLLQFVSRTVWLKADSPDLIRTSNWLVKNTKSAVLGCKNILKELIIDVSNENILFIHFLIQTLCFLVLNPSVAISWTLQNNEAFSCVITKNLHV